MRQGTAELKTILLVDDEFGIVDVLAMLLEDEGYRVFSAANGKQGLERIAENRPDLVISDFMMPIMNGAEMARAIRADSIGPAIPIIMMSSVPENSVRERFDGFDAFLRKPFKLPALLAAIGTLLEP